MVHAEQRAQLYQPLAGVLGFFGELSSQAASSMAETFNLTPSSY